MTLARQVRSAWLWSGALVGLATLVVAARHVDPAHLPWIAVGLPVLLALPDALVALWLRARRRPPGRFLRLVHVPIWLEFWVGFALGAVPAALLAA
jgi:hypothetical protein